MILNISQEIYREIIKSDPKSFWVLIIFLSITSLLEALGVLSVMPFIGALSSPLFFSKIGEIPILGGYLASLDKNNAIIILGSAVVVIALLVSMVSIATNLRMLAYAYSYEKRLSTRLFEKYLGLDHEAYSISNVSELSKNVLHEAHRLVHGVLVPWIQLIAKSISGAALITLLLFVNWRATIICGSLIGFGYFFVFYITRSRLKLHGDRSFESNARRHRVVNEAISGIKEVQHYALGQRFSKVYEDEATDYIHALIRSDAIASVPKYIFDALLISIAIGSLLVIGVGNNVQDYLPTISVFALASYRLMPIFHQLFNGLSVMRFNQRTVPVVLGELSRSNPRNAAESNAMESAGSGFGSMELTLDKVCYRYPSSNSFALNDINLTIPSHGIICIVGQSGSGKSTLLDLIAGVVKPSEGAVQVGGKEIFANIAKWRELVGFAGQHTPLFLGSLFENITLWGASNSTDDKHYENCIKLACLEGLVPEVETEIVELGKEGRSVSGGQRQRIGIARALYRSPKMLLLDEPTSALDSVTAHKIMNNLVGISKKIPIVIVSHDPAIARLADALVVIDGGKIVATGAYAAVQEKSKLFHDMVTSDQA